MTTISGIKTVKIGGSLLKSKADFSEIAHELLMELSKGKDVIVVISAMKGITDRLTIAVNENPVARKLLLGEIIEAYPEDLLGFTDKWDLAGSFSEIPLPGLNSNHESDILLTMGERLSAIALALKMIQMGIRALILDPSHIISLSGNGSFNKEISRENYHCLMGRLDLCHLYIVPGFYGALPDGSITTLGRGGSDYTAGIMSFLSGSSELEFWKDVGAVYTGDPTLIEDPRPILRINMDMLKGIVSAGSRILHPSSLDLVETESCRVTIKGIGGPGRSITELVSRDEECVSIIVGSHGNSTSLSGIENVIDKEKNSITIVTGGNPEYRNRILGRLRKSLELIVEARDSTLTTSEKVSTIIAPSDQCVSIARKIHRELVSGDTI